LAGGIILARNYRRLGQPERFWPTLLWSALGTAVLVGIGMAIPDNVHVSSMALIAPQGWGMYQIARQLQGQAIETPRAAGGRFVSRWSAAGISLVTCVALMLIALLVAATIVLLTTPTV